MKRNVTENHQLSSRKRKGETISLLSNNTNKRSKDNNVEERMKTYVTSHNRRITKEYQIKHVLVNIERISINNTLDSKSINKKNDDKPARKKRRKVVENPFYVKSTKAAKYDILKNPFFDNKKSSDVNKIFVVKEKISDHDSPKNAVEDSNPKSKEEADAKDVRENIVNSTDKDKIDCLNASMTVRDIEIIPIEDQNDVRAMTGVTNNCKSKMKQLFQLIVRHF